VNRVPTRSQPLATRPPQRRKRQPTRVDRALRSLLRHGPGSLRLDLLILLPLTLILGLIAAYLAATPPTRLAVGVADPDTPVAFRNFYGIERNELGAFRWSKPGSVVTIPAAAPADYMITLTLQDSPAAPPGRQATVYLNGEAVGQAILATAPTAYRFSYPFPPAAWSGDAAGTLSIELDLPPFTPPGDPRPLGAIITAVGVEAAGNSINAPVLLAFALALFLALYATLRLSGVRPFIAGAVCGLVLLGLAGAALQIRRALLLLIQQQLLHPTAASLLTFSIVAILAAWSVGVRHLPPAPDDAAQVAAAGNTAQAAGAARSATGWAFAGAVTALGFGVRLARVDALSLWLDETATLHFARLPWRRLLGLEGAYDPHPPLYYATVKIAATFLPEVAAGRLVSVLAGTATIPVLYALARRLTTDRAALLASLVLALAPLHIWYSQEARMYALALCFVALSYLALIAFEQTRRTGWVVLYGVVTLIALYTSYSSIYALAPQGLLFILVTLRLRRASAPLWLAAFGVGLGFLPWFGHVTGTIDATGPERAWYLGVSPGRIYEVALSAIGLKNRGSYIWGGVVTPWERSSQLLILLLLAFAALALLGLVRLARPSVLGSATVAGLFVGTIAVAAGISLISPGFADRTILAATLGWSIALGAAAFGRERAGRLDLVARGGVALALLVSLITFGAYTRGATKTDYRGLARDVATVTQLGTPIVADRWLGSALNAYQPSVKPIGGGSIGEGDAFWIAYLDIESDFGRDLPRLSASYGYERVLHRPHSDSLALDLYLRPGARLPAGVAVALPPPRPGGPSWQLPEEAQLEGAGDSPALRLTGASPATAVVPHTTRSIYLLEVETGGDLGGQGQIALHCLDAAQEPLFSSLVPTSAPQAAWRTARVATICPEGTASLQVLLRHDRGSGSAFRNMRLWQATPTATVAPSR
jgi:hypothetical protein